LQDNGAFAAIGVPPFRACAPWWGGDLQTLRNTLIRRVSPGFFAMPGTAMALPVADGSGDNLIAMFNVGADGARKPLAVLVHGLTGCHDSSYMVQTARYLTGLGHPVLRLNMRGAGPSAGTCRLRYHAAKGEDIAAALRALDPLLLRDGAVFVGYSLGGSVLLNFLARHAMDFEVRAAATVSTPIDLAATSVRINSRRNVLYQKYLIKRMKIDWAGTARNREERIALARIRTIREFDGKMVAPANGFRDADDYYAQCSATRVLPDIAVPTLLVQAVDDPWIPASSYRAFDWPANPRLTPLLAKGGGHVGFHANGAPPNWHDRCIAQVFAAH